ncbi:MAG: Cas10/Cmr2 second palm domain-containing protein [Pseudonocardiaceae bacterium]
MPRYVDVSVQHIQSYLVRAQHLKGRRGASTMITRATHGDAVTQCLGDLPATEHHEAGAVDGVISVRLDDAELTTEVTGRLVGHLRSALPAAVIVATYRDGSNYADAVAGDTDERRLARHLPVCAEWPAAKRCDWCNIWPASAVIIDGAGEDARNREVCLDCDRRDEAAGRSTQEGWKPLAEMRLRRHLADRPGSGPSRELPTNFEQLASLGPIPGERNHVATVLADGNAIGKLIAGLRQSAGAGGDSQVLREAPRTIDNATWAALTGAANKIDTTDAAAWRIIPHLVGGDDLLVSVPAHSAWEFVRTYLSIFGEKVSSLATNGLVPSASAGVVFHQIKDPFSVVADLGHDLLESAKKEHLGRSAALCWQSITHDGSARAPRRRSITLDGLHGSWDALTRFAQVSKSQRQVLARALRDDRGIGSQLDRVLSGDEPMRSVVEPFLGTDPPIPLQQAIGMVAWWWPR